MAAAIILLLLAAVLFYYYHLNLNQKGNPLLQCGLRTWTGFYCPGCGGQRAVHYYLHGQFLNGIRQNIMSLVLIPILMYYFFFFLRTLITGKPAPKTFIDSARFGKILLILLLLFTVLRNIPKEPFSLLAPF